MVVASFVAPVTVSTRSSSPLMLHTDGAVSSNGGRCGFSAASVAASASSGNDVDGLMLAVTGCVPKLVFPVLVYGR